MDYIVIAVIAAVVNLFLSILIPCIFKKINLPKTTLLPEIKKTLNNNCEICLISSLLVGIFVYLSLESYNSSIDPDEIELKRLFSLGTFDLSHMDTMDNMDNMSNMSNVSTMYNKNFY